MFETPRTNFNVRALSAADITRQGRFARHMLFGTLAAMSTVVGVGAYFLSLFG